MPHKPDDREHHKPLPPSLSSLTTHDGMWRIIYERDPGRFGFSWIPSISKWWKSCLDPDLIRLIKDTYRLGSHLFLLCIIVYLIRGIESACELYYSTRLIASVSILFR